VNPVLLGYQDHLLDPDLLRDLNLLRDLDLLLVL
jgi:hypothetical protein